MVTFGVGCYFNLQSYTKNSYNNIIFINNKKYDPI